MKKKIMRKPKLKQFDAGPIYSLGYNDGHIAPWMVARAESFEDIDRYFTSPETMREIANWFNQAADYLDAKKAKR